MLKTTKRKIRSIPTVIDSAQNDPHDAASLELMSIALSVARLRDIIGPRPDVRIMAGARRRERRPPVPA